MAKGIAVGLSKGHPVTKIDKTKRRYRPSHRKGKGSERTNFVKQIIRETVGFSHYEKRIIELLKAGTAKDAKKAYRFAKTRLGTHKRAQQKTNEMEEVIQQIKHAAQRKQEVEAQAKAKLEAAEKKKSKK